MKISEAFECGKIPMSYKGVFPEHCQCGAEIEISDSLTKLWCPNEKCDKKQIARLRKMLAKFEVKDIGESYCEDLWECLVRNDMSESHMNIFRLPYSEYPNTYQPEVTMKKFNSIQNVVKDSLFNGGYTLGNLVANMALPGLDMNARKLFAGFNSVEEMQLYARKMYGEYGLLTLIRRRFGKGVMCQNVVHTLAVFGSDIRIAQKIFNVKKAVSQEIRVAITGRITDIGRYSRKEFLKYCNDLCDGIAEVVDVSPSSSILFVVADDYINSSTYEYGEENNILINSVDFVDWLKDEVIGCE